MSVSTYCKVRAASKPNFRWGAVSSSREPNFLMHTLLEQLVCAHARAGCCHAAGCSCTPVGNHVKRRSACSARICPAYVLRYLACPNPCHAVEMSCAAQFLLVPLLNTTTALASAADQQCSFHICAPISPFLFAPSRFMLLTGTPASILTWCRSSLQAQWLSC